VLVFDKVLEEARLKGVGGFGDKSS